MTTKNDFAALVRVELANARSHHPPINSLHEGLAVIREEYCEFEEMVFLRAALREPKHVLEELVQVAAMCQRTAEDVALIGKLSDAVFRELTKPGKRRA